MKCPTEGNGYMSFSWEKLDRNKMYPRHILSAHQASGVKFLFACRAALPRNLEV
jgi:hypothetical protein